MGSKKVPHFAFLGTLVGSGGCGSRVACWELEDKFREQLVLLSAPKELSDGLILLLSGCQ